MRRLHRTLPFLVLLALVPAACATAGGSATSEGVDRPEEAVVEVTNYNWSDIHAYVFAGGQRFSLGLVTSQGTREFTLSRSVLSGTRDLVFVADPIGSVLAYVSDGVYVQPGDRVTWTVHNNLAQSSVSVF